MDFIAVHLRECPHCRGEYQSLLDTKRLLSSLAHRASRAEIESLLQSEVDNRCLESGFASIFRGALRPKPLTATVVLSLAGLWIASASLDSPADGVSPGSGGIASQTTAAMMPGLDVGVRSLRHLYDAVHAGAFSAVVVPVSSDGLVISSGHPYPLSPSGDGRYRPSTSLNTVVFRATDGRTTSSAASVYPVSVSGGSAPVYGASSQRSGTGSESAYRPRHEWADRLR